MTKRIAEQILAVAGWAPAVVTIEGVSWKSRVVLSEGCPDPFQAPWHWEAEPPWGWRLETLQEAGRDLGRCSSPDSADCRYTYGPQGNPFTCTNQAHHSADNPHH